MTPRRDPFVTSMLLLSALVVAGLVGIAVAWRGAAASLIVAIQLPYIVSGALGGVALLGFALALICIQSTRRAEAQERAEMTRFGHAAAQLLGALRDEDARSR